MNLEAINTFTMRYGTVVCLSSALSITALLPGCATQGQTAAAVAGSILGVTTAGAYKIGPEIQQVYYLGMFDHSGQLPTQMYRVTVHGQASIISGMTFGSGWVPAALVDTLECQITPATNKASETTPPLLCTPRNQPNQQQQDKNKLPADKQPVTPSGESNQTAVGSTTVKGANDSTPSPTQPDGENGTAEETTKFWALGPEATRKVPKDHRLVIVMGGDADKFFQKIDEVLGDISPRHTPAPLSPDQKIQVNNGLVQARNAQVRIEELDALIRKEFALKP